MKIVEIKAHKRDKIGKNKVDKLRQSTKVPAILYGKESIPLVVEDPEAKKLYSLRHENFLVKLMIDDMQAKEALLKDIQLNPVKNNVIHLDFLELVQDRPIKVKVPVELDGTPVGLKQGGITQHFLWDLTVKCLPKDIPEHIKVDISSLDIGDSIHVKDIKVDSKVKVCDKSSQVVITIGLPTGVIEERQAAAAAAAAAAEAAAAAAAAGVEAGAEGEEGAAVPGAEGAAAPGTEGAPAAVPGKPGATGKPGAPVKPGTAEKGKTEAPGTPAAKGKTPGAPPAKAPGKK
ncbi:MAG: 50S ribosomal protein L25 [bacterium]|nr:50S ribosomal protein L25 [bacterium]